MIFTSHNHDAVSDDKALAVVRDLVGIEHHLEWRRQSATCESAYRLWATTANSSDRKLAFAAYVAALSREEQSAAQYEAALITPAS